MKFTHSLAAAVAAGALLLQPIAALALDGADVQRPAPNQVTVSWQGADPVDVYVSTKPDASIAEARRVARADRQGVFVMERNEPARPYFILKDERDGSTVRVAERLLPLERGSNFRDVGGYPAAGGKHVRWGLIYRSGATPMLTAADFRYLATLGIAADIDLRSTEERQIAPDRLPDHTGALYLAPRLSRRRGLRAEGCEREERRLAGQSLSQLAGLAGAAVPRRLRPASEARRRRHLPLLRRPGPPRAWRPPWCWRRSACRATSSWPTITCRPRTAGSEPRTRCRRSTRRAIPAISSPPTMPRRRRPENRPNPGRLYDASGVALLKQTFDEIDTHWGSVDNYLDKELGINALDIARLRAAYLE